MLSLSVNNHADVIKAFISSSRYLDDLLYIGIKWLVRYIPQNFS